MQPEIKAQLKAKHREQLRSRRFTSTRFEFPIPFKLMSLNHAYVGMFGRGGRIKTDEVRDYKRRLEQHLATLTTQLPDAVVYGLEIMVPATQKADLDNLAKLLVDSLHHMALTPDDKHLVELTMRKRQRAEFASVAAYVVNSW